MSRLETEVCRLIERQTAAAAQPRRLHPVGGGCIHETGLLELEDGRRYFVKSSRSMAGDVFEREAEGLRALAAGPLRVPAVVGVGKGESGFLVLEAIESGARREGFFEDFGRAFARLHRERRGESFGFTHDNYLGATPQPNGTMDDWVEFWRHRRLGHQVELARRSGEATPELLRLADRLADRLEDLIGGLGEAPSLLHGDLWSGNFLCDEASRPVLIDPAAYYGHREADLAMTRLFGGFPPSFYRAYEEVWPLAPDSERRLVLYELHHLLNHLNLFGAGYLSRCLDHLRRLTS